MTFGLLGEVKNQKKLTMLMLRGAGLLTRCPPYLGFFPNAFFLPQNPRKKVEGSEHYS